MFHMEQSVRKEKGAEAPCHLGSSGRAVDSQRIGYAEAVSLASLVPDVTGIKVAVHLSLQSGALEVLHAVRYIGDDEEGVGVSQEVID